MKCIHCESDTKLKDRTANGRRCAQCGHAFAFEPTTDARKVSDGLFHRCVVDVSGDSTLFFTEKQLWYEMNRRLARKITHIPRPYGIGAGVCAAGGAVGIIAGLPILLPIGIVAAIAALALGAQAGKKNPPPRVVVLGMEEFRAKYLGPFAATHGALTKMLADPRAKSQTLSADAPPDLASYSFDRALVTDHAEIAAMLVANRFHFENNCAILSLDGGFPANGRFDTILDMLKRNPGLTVFTLHDASREGMQVPLALRRGKWFNDLSVRVVDLGLRPLQAMKSGMMTTNAAPAAPPEELASRLSPEETAWLAQGNQTELAALRPAHLMRAIYQGFNTYASQTDGWQDDDGGIIIMGGYGYGYGPDVWVGGGGADAFATDSFG